MWVASGALDRAMVSLSEGLKRQAWISGESTLEAETLTGLGRLHCHNTQCTIHSDLVRSKLFTSFTAGCWQAYVTCRSSPGPVPQWSLLFCKSSIYNMMGMTFRNRQELKDADQQCIGPWVDYCSIYWTALIETSNMPQSGPEHHVCSVQSPFIWMFASRLTYIFMECAMRHLSDSHCSVSIFFARQIV